MSNEDLKVELEQLRKENAALKKEFASRTRLKVSEKPLTLYKEEWLKLLVSSSDIRSFIGEQGTIKGQAVSRNRAMPRRPSR